MKKAIVECMKLKASWTGGRDRGEKQRRHIWQTARNAIIQGNEGHIKDTGHPETNGSHLDNSFIYSTKIY